VPSHESALTPLDAYGGTYVSFGPLESTTQTANRSVQPFLHSSRQIRYSGRPFQSREWVDGSWVMGQMGHENGMGHMGHGSLGVDP